MLGDSDASSAQRLGHGRAAGRLGPSHGLGQRGDGAHTCRAA